MTSISRRRLLLGTGAVAGVVAIGGVTWAWVGNDDRRAPSAVGDRVRAFFGSVELVAPLGDDYLEANPETIDELIRALAPAQTDPMAWFDAAGDEAFASHVRSSVRGEFERGEVIDVAGWMLAPTEARCCALASLS